MCANMFLKLNAYAILYTAYLHSTANSVTSPLLYCKQRYNVTSPLFYCKQRYKPALSFGPLKSTESYGPSYIVQSAISKVSANNAMCGTMRVRLHIWKHVHKFHL